MKNIIKVKGKTNVAAQGNLPMSPSKEMKRWTNSVTMQRASEIGEDVLFKAEIEELLPSGVSPADRGIWRMSAQSF